MERGRYVVFLVGVLVLLVGIADLVVNGEMGRAMVAIGTVLMAVAGKRIYDIEETGKANR